MKRVPAILFLSIAVPLFAADVPPPASAPPLLTLPDTNPLACPADSPPAFVTRDFPSGVEVTIPAFTAIRVGATGAIEDVLFVHDPIPSLEAQERQSFQKWEFNPPTKGGAPVAGWATIELDLHISYSRPQIQKATVVPVGAQDPVPAADPRRWDQSWVTTAPALTDLKGAESAEALDQPALPKRTKWYADRYKGPLAVKLWVEIGQDGRATRMAPVDVKDAALLPYLEKAIGKWTFNPARKNGQAMPCWSVLELGGTISYDVDLIRASSIKKSVGP
ncbi:MAG TPA: hypothetical protein VFL12_11185 [Thermoanaerobaculia bacterium]|nr:hypothetical protein [Thermoanaerobaculia bacterium]